MTSRLHLLRGSVEHLGDVASRIDESEYASPAYPSEWTVADTFSHLGSGAVIGERRFEDSVEHRDSDPTFNTSVWDEWNAKDPAAQVQDALVSDVSFLTHLEASSEEQRQNFHFTMGPFSFDFDGLVGLRLSEHVLHTWDVEVTLDPHATVSNDAANGILDTIQSIVTRTGKPTGETKKVTVRTIAPVREFTVVLDVDSVELVETHHDGATDLEIPAEAMVRLIYGRLDEERTPTSVSGDVVNYLRRVFPGF